VTAINTHSKPSLIEIRRFYLGLSFLLAILATIGFWPQYFQPLLTGSVEKNSVIHLHATVYVGWLALFICQCFLVAVGNIKLHRRVGNFGLVYGCGVVIVGLSTTIVQFAANLEENGIAQVQHTGLFPITDMILFSAFFGAAAYYRKNPELHKRLMIVAASTILIASTGRFTLALGAEGAAFHLVNLSLWLSPILLAMGYDIVRYRIVHPVYVIGGGIIAISNFRDPLRYTDTWVSFTHWLASTLS
jgi:hypothetical protein